MKKIRLIFCGFMVACLISTSAVAEVSGGAVMAVPKSLAGESLTDMQKLAKESQNPVADMATFPLKNNFYAGEGIHKRFGYTLDIQPVYPINIGKWNFISRTIMPVVYQPYITRSEGGKMGLGDISETIFASPAKPWKFFGGDFIGGLGPMITAPTSTDKWLGAQKWTIGPSGVLVWMPGRWVLGTLLYNQWSFAGPASRQEVNAMTLQYFINYNFNKGWFLASSPINTFNWKAHYGDRALLPFGGGIGRVFAIGKQPVSLFAGGYYNAVRPEGNPSWQFVATCTLLFPKHK